MLMGNIQI